MTAKSFGSSSTLDVFIATDDNLYLSDSETNRVLVFLDPETLGNNPSADFVLGQSDFTSNTSTSTASGLKGAQFVGEDTHNGLLYVVDFSGKRVLGYENSALFVNSAPTDINISASSIAENSTSGSTIGTLSTTDANSGDTHTYSFCGGTDDSSFSISSSTLKTNTTLDYETKTSYSVCVRSTDSNSSSYDENLSISITNVNETTNGSCGTANQSTFSSKPSSGLCMAGTASSVSDTGSSFSWSCSGTTVGADTGSAANCSATKNHSPTDITLSTSSIAENSALGTTIGTFSSTDSDSSDTYTYSFCGGSDDSKFTISGSSINTATSLDYETRTSYSICIRTTDNNSATYDKTLTISITDVDESSSSASSGGNSSSSTSTPTLVRTLPDKLVDVNNTASFDFNVSSYFSNVTGFGATLDTNASLPSWLSLNTSTGVFTIPSTDDNASILGVKYIRVMGSGSGDTNATGFFALRVKDINASLSSYIKLNITATESSGSDSERNATYVKESGTLFETYIYSDGGSKHIAKDSSGNTLATATSYLPDTNITVDSSGNVKTEVSTINSSGNQVSISVDGYVSGTDKASHSLVVNSRTTTAISKIDGAVTYITSDRAVETNATLNSATLHAKANADGTSEHIVSLTGGVSSKALSDVLGATTTIAASGTVTTEVNATSDTTKQAVIATSVDGTAVPKLTINGTTTEIIDSTTPAEAGNTIRIYETSDGNLTLEINGTLSSGKNMLLN